ncbi:MAG TPA: MarR family winged helix-turn-helix transcriptional regulator [Acidimicrobiales bacterium]
MAVDAMVEEEVAVELAVAMTHLRARLRAEAGANATGLSSSQLSIIRRLIDDGAATAASLAAAEHVSQQAVAQNLMGLKAEGFVSAEPDPRDGRKSLIRVTDAGHRLVETILASRDAWLVRAIEATIPVDERADLRKAIELLERLADADLHPRAAIR